MPLATLASPYPVAPDPVRHIIIATPWRDGTFFKKIAIQNGASVSEVMRTVQANMEPMNVILAPLFERRVAIGTSPEIHNSPLPSKKLGVFVTNCRFDQNLALSYHLAHASSIDSTDAGSQSFVANYSQLLVSEESHHVLVISSTFKDKAKLGILILAVLVTIVSGLAVGLATRDIGTGFGCIGAGIAVIGIFVVALGKKTAHKRTELTV